MTTPFKMTSCWCGHDIDVDFEVPYHMALNKSLAGKMGCLCLGLPQRLLVIPWAKLCILTFITQNIPGSERTNLGKSIYTRHTLMLKNTGYKEWIK
jgi:hypothetical protein